MMNSVNGLIRLRPGVPRLNGFASAQRHAGKRVFSDVNRNAGFVRDQLIQAAQKRAAARENDASLHDIGG